MTSFYGHPITSKREETWSILESLGRANQLPWLYIRDYNEIVSQSEKSGGRLWLVRQLDKFRQAIHPCRFQDLGFVGSPFTWSKTDCVEGRMRIILDRALANNAWRLLFHGAAVHHLSMSASDHSMLFLRLRDDCHNRQKDKKLFRFEEMWLSDS